MKRDRLESFVEENRHEFDHLEGVLFVDRLSMTGKALVQGKLKRLKRGR